MLSYRRKSDAKSPNSIWPAVVFVLLALFSAQTLAQKKGSPKPAVEPTATPEATPVPSIPLPQIAPRADEAIQKLREMSDSLTHDPESIAIEETLKTQE